MTQSLSDLIAARRAYLIGQVMESTPGLTRDEAEHILNSVTKSKSRKAA